MAYFTSADSRMEFKFRAVDFMMAANKGNSIKHIVRGIFVCQQEENEKYKRKIWELWFSDMTTICSLKTETSKVLWYSCMPPDRTMYNIWVI